MSSKITGITLSIGIIFLTLLIFILTTKINITEPAQLYVQKSATFLVLNNTKLINELKTRDYVKVVNPKINATTLLYVNKKANNLSDNIISLKKASNHDEGWYNVIIQVRKETFSQHYLGF